MGECEYPIMVRDLHVHHTRMPAHHMAASCECSYGWSSNTACKFQVAG